MRSLFRLLTFDGRPSKVKDSNYRTYSILCVVCIFAIIVHSALIPTFLLLGLTEMSYLNYGSVCLWLVGLLFNINGNHSSTIKIISIEVLIHSYFAVSTLGLSLGFQHYLWAVVCVVLLLQDIPKVFTVVVSFTVIIFIGVLHFLFGDVQYLYQYPEYTPFINLANVMVAGIPLTYAIVSVLHTTSKKELFLINAAAKDEFTGLYNKHFSYEMLSIVLSQADRLNSPVCIVKGSIDHLSNIEDTYGDDVAKQLLFDVSFFVKETIRCSDIAAIWENNEFFIVLSGTDLELAYKKIDNLRKDIYEAIKIGETKNISISASFGLAEWAQGDPVNTIIEQANEALEASNKKGYNCTSLYQHKAQLINTM